MRHLYNIIFFSLTTQHKLSENLFSYRVFQKRIYIISELGPKLQQKSLWAESNYKRSRFGYST